MRNLLFLLSLIFVLTLSSCFLPYQKTAPIVPDNPYGLPNATQTGENMFACRINDKNWIVYDGMHSDLGTSFLTSNSRDTFAFDAEGGSSGFLDLITFRVFSRIQQGNTYRLNDITKAYVRTFRTSAPCGPISGYGGSQWNYGADGFITVTKFGGTYAVRSSTIGTYDTAAIFSGTFNFIIAIPNCDSIKVTDGRFDFNYSNH